MSQSPAANHPRIDSAAPLWLWLITAVAVLIGVYGRFKGLGLAPLGVDEFYVSRSVDNVLRTGLPEFLCGGYYNRGPIYQYLVSLVRLAGLTPELAGRLIAAISSLAVLPAVYLLGRRVHGRAVGLLAVTVLALSVWEIEMARFGRMYAPFQAVFVWYLLCLLRYIEDRSRNALVGIVLLSCVGVLTWEGGVLCGILNFLPPLIRHREGRLQKGDWLYLGGMLVLFSFLYLAATVDLRTFAAVPAFGARSAVNTDRTAAISDGALSALVHSAWIWLAAIAAICCLWSTRWLWSLRSRWLAACGLTVALAAAFAHQFLITFAALILLLLTRLVDWREFRQREARPYAIAVCACGVFWLAFGLVSTAWREPGQSPVLGIAQVATHLFGFPDLIGNVLRPWGRTVPILSLVLLVAIGMLALRAIRDNTQSPASPERERTNTLLIAICVLVLAVSSISADRRETRYLFFLYPVFIVLAVLAAAQLIAAIRNTKLAAVALTLAVLLCFAISEDFQPGHIRHIDSPEILFRVGMRPALIDHYYPHNDVRSAGQWLTQHVGARDLVINGIPSLDGYYHRSDLFYMDEQDNRYEAFACARGSVDRWTNTPILDGTSRLQSTVQTGRKIYLIAYPSFARRILDEAQFDEATMRRAWSSIDGGIEILVFNDGSAETR